MNIFLNDYNDLCHNKVLEKINEVQNMGNPGYGEDRYTARAKELIKKELVNDEVDIQFVAGGTIANIIAISANLMPYEGIIAANTGHIVAHETGSIEATGHRVEMIDTEDGKLSKKLIEEKLKYLDEEHTIVPKMVYISQTTELGTVYSYEEIAEIYDLCIENGMYLYIDGARMANGLAASDIDIYGLPDICDIFTLGGTKNGAMFGEAIVIVADELQQNIRNFMRQRGAVIAKGFLTGAQFEALFEDGLYYELGKKAQKMSRLLVEKLYGLVKFHAEPASNQIFIEYPAKKIEKLAENNLFEVQQLDEENRILRFVTTYKTTEEEIDSLVSDLKNLENWDGEK